jgi:hypothetical protein
MIKIMITITTTTITKTITEITITILIVTTNMAITLALLVGGNSGRHATIAMDKTIIITITTKCSPHGGVSKMKDDKHTHTHTHTRAQTRNTNLETQIVVFLFCIFSILFRFTLQTFGVNVRDKEILKKKERVLCFLCTFGHLLYLLVWLI